MLSRNKPGKKKNKLEYQTIEHMKIMSRKIAKGYWQQ